MNRDDSRGTLTHLVGAERGVSMSVFWCVAVVALFILAGLVIDGAHLLSVKRELHAVTSRAARAGVEATSPYRAMGLTVQPSVAVKAAQDVLAESPEYQCVVEFTDPQTLSVDSPHLTRNEIGFTYG